MVRAVSCNVRSARSGAGGRTMSISENSQVQGVVQRARALILGACYRVGPDCGGTGHAPQPLHPLCPDPCRHRAGVRDDRLRDLRLSAVGSGHPHGGLFSDRFGGGQLCAEPGRRVHPRADHRSLVAPLRRGERPDSGFQARRLFPDGVLACGCVRICFRPWGYYRSLGSTVSTRSTGACRGL